MGMGVFSDSGLRWLIAGRIIQSKSKIKEEQIQPSSLDLTLGNKGFCLPFSSIPPKGDLEEYFQKIKNYQIDLRKKTFFHKKNVYVIEINESLNLPEYFTAKANPKSSIGRTDIHVRLITENGPRFDMVSGGYKGKLWLEFYSNSFDVILKEGISLNQLRILDKNSEKLSESKLICLHRDQGILFNKGKLTINSKLKQEVIEPFLREGVVDIRLDLGNKISGYVAKPNTPPVDLLKKDNPASKFFDVIKIIDGKIIIPRGVFYILNSLEIINIPSNYCAEMSDVETISGEFRAHYAGFFDPGFFAQGVVELRNLGAPFLLKHGQKIASLNFYNLKFPSKKVYGKHMGSTYQHQKGPTLAKFFDMNK